MKELEKQQKHTNDQITLASMKSYDYKTAMEMLARQKLPDNSPIYIAEKKEIMANTNALIAKLKATQAIMKLTE